MTGLEAVTAAAKGFVGERCWIVIGGREYEAKVTGRKNLCATIGPLDASIPAVEFSWHTVNRVMRRNRRFVS